MLRFIGPMMLLSTLLLLPACGDKDDTETPEGDTDTDADTDADADADADTDADADADLGLQGYSGQATAGLDGFEGSEDMYLIAEEGDGDDICRIRYELKDTDSRPDCPDAGHSGCLWAWEVSVSAAAIVAESGIGCAGAFGVTADSVSELDGTSFGLGYNPDYYGHAAVMVRDPGDGWFVASFAIWDEDTGSFTYQWDQGFVQY